MPTPEGYSFFSPLEDRTAPRPDGIAKERRRRVASSRRSFAQEKPRKKRDCHRARRAITKRKWWTAEKETKMDRDKKTFGRAFGDVSTLYPRLGFFLYSSSNQEGTNSGCRIRGRALQRAGWKKNRDGAVDP